MKKFVTTILICFLSLTCIFALTACNDNSGANEEPAEVVTTVTEEEWEKAFALFCNEPYGEGKAPLSFTCSGIASDDPDTVIKLYVDCERKALYFYVNSSERGELKEYSWLGQDGNLYSSDGISVHPDTNHETIYQIFEQYFDLYAGTMFMKLMCIGKYGDFTYNAETKEYISGENKMTFADGKLTKMTAITKHQSQVVSAVYEYEYNANVTIPEKVLNLLAQ